MKKFQLKLQKRAEHRGGFTLIELVMVIMILAIVAGLAVPIVGWLRRSANYGAQANTTAAIGSNMEFFRTTYGNDGYPGHLDSLVLTGTSNPIYSISGYTDSGIGAGLYTVGDLDADQTACLQFLDHVYDHDSNKHAGLQGNPGNSAIHERDLASPATSVAIINNFDADSDPNTITEADRLLLEIYPDGVPSDVTLVAFGVGPQNDMIGRTMQSAPLDPRVDNSEVYGRYVAVFATYSPRAGRRAQLKAVLNAKGRTTNNALSEFWQSTAPE